MTYLEALCADLEQSNLAHGGYPNEMSLADTAELPTRLREQPNRWYIGEREYYLFAFESPSFAMNNVHFFDSRTRVWRDAISHPDDYAKLRDVIARKDDR